jgi:hypothetical protein
LTLITIAFGIIGVVGTVYTILAWRRRKEKLPYYDIRSDSIIRDLTSRFEHLRVVYDGESIRDFTATHVVFWNGGRDPIRHDDVPPSNPIAVRLKEGGRILDATKLADNNPDSQFRISVTDDHSTAKCDFEYADVGQGVVLQVLHTGKSEDYVEVKGTVIGAGNIKRKSIIADPTVRRQTKWSVAAFALGAAGYVWMFHVTPAWWPLALLGTVVLGGAAVWNVSDLFRKKVPKGLEAFARS